MMLFICFQSDGWELDGEGAADAGGALQFDLTMVCFYHILYVREAEAESLDGMDIACGGSVESLEDVLLFLSVHADAVVGDVDEQFSVCVVIGADGDMWRFGGVLECVVEQVEEHIAEVCLIAPDLVVGCLQVDVKRALSLMGADAELLLYDANHLVHIEFGLDEVGAALVVEGELQHSLDHHGETLGLVGDDAQNSLVGLLGMLVGRVEEHLTCQIDAGQGGLEFVGHVVDEVVLHLVDRLLLDDGVQGDPEDAQHANNQNDRRDGKGQGIHSKEWLYSIVRRYFRVVVRWLADLCLLQILVCNLLHHFFLGRMVVDVDD